MEKWFATFGKKGLQKTPIGFVTSCRGLWPPATRKQPSNVMARDRPLLRVKRSLKRMDAAIVTKMGAV